MKKQIFASILTVLFCHTAFASTSPESIVLSKVLLRQVPTKQLVTDSDTREAIRAALEGAGGSQIHTNIAGAECEPALGKDECVISIRGDVYGEAYSADIDVISYQGTVQSATVSFP
jgi:hypothetical protein